MGCKASRRGLFDGLMEPLYSFVALPAAAATICNLSFLTRGSSYEQRIVCMQVVPSIFAADRGGGFKLEPPLFVFSDCRQVPPPSPFDDARGEVGRRNGPSDFEEAASPAKLVCYFEAKKREGGGGTN